MHVDGIDTAASARLQLLLLADCHQEWIIKSDVQLLLSLPLVEEMLNLQACQLLPRPNIPQLPVLSVIHHELRLPLVEEDGVRDHYPETTLVLLRPKLHHDEGEAFIVGVKLGMRIY